MERKLIGRVAVDSGQLMVIDPCYIEEYWRKEKESKTFGIKFWGSDAKRATIFLLERNHHVTSRPDGSGFIPATEKEDIDKIKCDLNDFFEQGLGAVFLELLLTVHMKKYAILLIAKTVQEYIKII